MSTDWRALCAELTDALASTGEAASGTYDALVQRARAALAEPVGEGPTDEELDALVKDHCWDPTEWIDYRAFARAVLARYGHQPAPPVEGEVGELVAWLRETGDLIQPSHLAEHQRYKRTADLLERQAAPAPAGEVVPLPINADQAALMAILGEQWLSQNAPERLRRPAPAPAGAVDLGDDELWDIGERHLWTGTEDSDPETRILTSFIKAARVAIAADRTCRPAPLPAGEVE